MDNICRFKFSTVIDQQFQVFDKSSGLSKALSLKEPLRDLNLEGGFFYALSLCKQMARVRKPPDGGKPAKREGQGKHEA